MCHLYSPTSFALNNSGKDRVINRKTVCQQTYLENCQWIWLPAANCHFYYCRHIENISVTISWWDIWIGKFGFEETFLFLWIIKPWVKSQSIQKLNVSMLQLKFKLHPHLSILFIQLQLNSVLITIWLIYMPTVQHLALPVVMNQIPCLSQSCLQ